MKRLIMCCDGTWNTAGQPCPTNVEKMFKAIAPSDASGVQQVGFYHDGVGVKRWQRLRGGAFGFGLSRNVQDTYSFLIDNYEPDDELFLLGFSRGAYTARSTAGFIRNAGILRPEHKDLVEQAYAMYRNKAKPDATTAVAFRKQYSYADMTPIRFIGVWDTVGSLGVPDLGLPGVKWLNRRWEFHDTTLSSRVQSAFQALAIDEARRPFMPTLWEPRPTATNQQLEQVWFTGVHCDVGGGYKEGELSDISFYWMSLRAQACGLALTSALTAPDVTGKLHDSRTLFYKLIKPCHRPIGAKDPAHEYVGSTATQRHKQDPRYAPPELVKYLDGPHQEMPI